jgi:hypothetical protein
MKAKKYLALAVFIIGGTIGMTSCVQKNYYGVNPNNNHNNNNGSGYTYVFDEEFNGSDNYGWTFTDATDSAYASISNGSYQYVDYSAVKSNMSVVSTGANTTGNFSVQASIKSNNIMGLIFGASSSDNGYAFYVDTAGHYSLYKEGTGTTASTTIIASTADSTAVKNGWNTIEIDQANGNWTGFINGTQIFQITARALAGANFGFKVLPATVGYADYLVVKSY